MGFGVFRVRWRGEIRGVRSEGVWLVFFCLFFIFFEVLEFKGRRFC